MNAEQLGREIEALRHAVAKAERLAREADDRTVQVMDMMRLMARSTANHQQHLSARLAASIAMVRGEDPRIAYLEVRDRFKAEAPRLYDPMQWGDRPDWLASLVRGATPAANSDGKGTPP